MQMRQALQDAQSRSIASSPGRRPAPSPGKPDYHMHYLRAESHRKALAFQKKYLLMLLGRFQETEDHTLAFVSRLSGQPHALTHRDRASVLHRAKRCVVAVIFLKRLVRLSSRWHAGGFAWREPAGRSLPPLLLESASPGHRYDQRSRK